LLRCTCPPGDRSYSDHWWSPGQEKTMTTVSDLIAEPEEFDDHALWLVVWYLGAHIPRWLSGKRIPCRGCMGYASYVKSSGGCPGYGCHDCGWFKPSRKRLGIFPVQRCVYCGDLLSVKTARIRRNNLRHRQKGIGGPYCSAHHARLDLSRKRLNDKQNMDRD
jgi:hypothetical protein